MSDDYMEAILDMIDEESIMEKLWEYIVKEEIKKHWVDVLDG